MLAPTPPMYWDSTEAKKLFCPSGIKENSHDAVMNQINLLSDALEYHDGYLQLLKDVEKLTKKTSVNMKCGI